MKFLFILLFINTAFSIVINENDQKCVSEKIESFHTRLNNLSDYHKIDKKGFKYLTFNALDMVQSQAIRGTNNQEFIFSLRPLPNHVSSLTAKEYPHFTMSCIRGELEDNGFTFNCKKTDRIKFVVDNIDINLTFLNDSQACLKGQTLIKISYELDINDAQYAELVGKIKADLSRRYPSSLINFVIDKMIDARTFFSEYWRFFFIQWLS